MAWRDRRLEPVRVERHDAGRRPDQDDIGTADGEQAIAVEHEELYVRGVAAFCAALRGEGRPAATAEDGIRSLNAALAVVEACRLGSAVDIHDPL